MSAYLRLARRLALICLLALWHVFHLKFPRMKHEENSLRGIHEAHARGDDEIDIDLGMDAAGNIYGDHWPEPMVRDGFRDTAPAGKRMPLHKRFRTMTAAQIARLVAVTRGRRYRIQRIERLLKECAKVGIGAVLEPKGDPRFNDPKVWEYLAKVADDLGVHIRVYALPANAAALRPARTAGLRASQIKGKRRR